MASSKFELYSTEQTKQLAVAVQIDGVPGLLSSAVLYKNLKYGDPGTLYGGPGLFYGGLIPLDNYGGGQVRSLLSLQGSSLTLTQTLEPEQGRGSISQLSLSFIDANGYMTQLCSPGVIVDEIMGRNVTVFLGYAQLGFPDDYYVVFRGVISSVTSAPGLCTFQLSDPNIVRKQQVFYTSKTSLSAPISPTDTTITLGSNNDFYQSILGPNGSYDPAIKLYLKINDEWIEYGPTASNPSGTFGVNTLGNVIRGARGTVATAASAGDDVTVGIEVEDNAIDMALKLMLSGWDGPWKTGIALRSIVRTGEVGLGDQPGALILPAGVDADRDYGLVAGDYITITLATNPGNNTTVKILSFADMDTEANRLIYTDNSGLLPEETTSAVFSTRSQYDTYPLECGIGLTPNLVDITRHLDLKQIYFGGSQNTMRFFIQDTVSSCKTFIESELYLPISAYSLTRFGRLSMGVTRPPVADLRLRFINSDSIINPNDLKPVRGLNNRKYFSEVQFNFDLGDDNSTYASNTRTLDSDAITLIGISSVLPINSSGGRTDLGFDTEAAKRSQRLLSRYSRGAVQISPIVTWGAGVEIEAGDVVALTDDGTLKIANYGTGQRNLGTQLFEVTNRSLSLTNGNITLTLTAGVGGQAGDRFGVISPSSHLDTGSTTSQLKIKDSYGAIFPGNEKKKWENYVGQKILIHDDLWIYSQETVLVSFDAVNPYLVNIDPPLGFTPVADMVMDIINYPTTDDPTVASAYKAIHVFLDPTVSVTVGGTDTTFTVSVGDAAKFIVGATVLAHAVDWSYKSDEVKVTDVNYLTGLVTVGSMGISPIAGDKVDLIGFPDKGGAYRWL